MESCSHWSYIFIIIRVFSDKIAEIPDLILIVIKRLVITILEFMKKDKKTYRSIQISNCWNTIRTICEQKLFIAYRDAIERELMPLFDFMNKPDEIDFDDEVVAIMKSFIQLSGNISQIEWTLFNTFPAIFDKCSNILSTIFTPLNYIIMYGKDVIGKNPETLDMVQFMNQSPR